MKNKLVRIFIFIILPSLAIVALYNLTNKQSKNIQLIDALGGNPAIAIKTKDIASFYNYLKTDCNTFQELNCTFGFDNRIFIDKIIKELIDSIPLISDPQAPIEAILSIEKRGSQLYQTAIINFDKSSDCSNASAKITEIYSTSNQINKKEYKGLKIYEIKQPNANIFFSSISNLLIVSSSSLGVEQSIDAQKDNLSLCQLDKGFQKIFLSSGKHEMANLFINLNEFPNLLGCRHDESLRRKIKNFAKWACLDINASSEMLTFNGLIYDQDSVNTFSKVLKTQTPQKFNSIEVLPDKTVYYLCFAFNKPLSFNNKLKEYLLDNNETYLSKREEDTNKIDSSNNIDIKSIFYDLIEDEICISAIDFGDNASSDDSFAILKLKSQNSAINAIEKLIRQSVSARGESIYDYKSEINISDKVNIPCYRLPITGIPELLFGNIFDKCEGKYLCFVNNFMIFSDSKESLYKFAYSALLNRTLATNIEHNIFLEQFSTKSLMLFYLSVDKGKGLLQDNTFFPDSINSTIKTKLDDGSKMRDIGFQINNIDDLLYNNIVIKSSSSEVKLATKQIRTKWESRLEDRISIKPTIVINHNNKEKEILIQDEKNNLYLLNNQGIELWRIKLNEKITSKVHQVDLYKNGKLQYLFSSENNLHLIDRLGNYIEKYPVLLRSTASAGMSLFDYEKNHNYRIAIPCTDNKVYLYDGFGNIVKGWEFDKTERIVSSEISHYSISGEDFIVFHDEYRAYLINRAGQTKVKFQTDYEFSLNNKIWLDNTVEQKRFVTTDKNGTIRLFYPGGHQDSLKVRDSVYSSNHFFALEDIDGDGKLDYIFLDGNDLEVYNRNKKVILTHTFEDKTNTAPLFFKFSNNKSKIGVVSKRLNNIYIINQDGTLHEDFPLKGNTAFSIGNLYNGKSDKFNLLVGSTDNLLYNYEINTK